MFEQLKDNLTQHLQQITRERDPYLANGGHFYVKEYLRQELGQFGELDSQIFEFRGKSCENIIARLPCRAEVSHLPPILIGAHYDTVPSTPGADDNGTGLAVLLELARWASQTPLSFPLHLVAFDMEEYGLLGSRAYAKFLKQQKISLRLMLSLEMLGYCNHAPNSQRYPRGLKYFYPSAGNFIALVGNLRTILDLIRLNHQMQQTPIPCEWLTVPLGGWLVPDTRRSDHSPFWNQGYNAILVTDTANLRNPHYHKPSDTLDTLDLDFLTRVCHGLMQGIKGLK